MNWFKKQINRLFDSDIEDEDYYEEEFEELPAPPQKAEEKQLDDDLQNKRKSFKFPLIDDEDMELPQEPSQSFNGETQSDISRRFEEAKRETKHFYQPNAISKVYDVEVSGIRELLEKRQRIKGTSTVINRQESTRLRRVEKAKKQETVKNTFKNTATPTQRKQVEEEPLEPKRKFVPTQVPSPVYGYKRPSNIDQLLLKKQEKAEEKPVKEENEPERKEILQDSAIEPKTFDEMPASDAKQGTSSPVVSKEHLQTYSAQIEEPIQQATVPSFLEIEDEVTVVVEEEPINLKEERYETVEELPILAEAVESSPIVEVQELQSLKPADTIVYAAANQEAAVTVYEEEITEVVEKLPEPIQVEEQESELPTVVEQQDEPLFHEKLESVEEIIEEQEDEASIEEVVNAIAEEIPSQEIEQRSIQEEINVISPDTDYRKIPIQSTQVQKLVSIALRDSELEEDTEIEAQQMQQEKLAEPAQQKPSQVLGVQDYVEAYTEPFEVTETFAPERGEGETSPSEEGEEVQEKPQSTGTTLPFNVLMLKSDKEKYAAKLAQKQMLHHNDDIKEMFRQTTKDEVQQSNSEIQEELEPASTNIETNEQVESKHEYPTMDREEVQLREDQDVVKYAEPEPVSIHEEADETPIEVEVDSVEEKKPPKIYVKPSLDFLSPPEEKTEDREWLESQADVLVESLSYFQVTAQVESITQGPAVTQFEITVGHGTKVSKVRNLSDDLKLALAAKDIRIQAPIPGKSTIGIEIPNRISRAVQLSEVTCSDSFSQSESPLEAALGLDLTGRPVTIDLRKMPHGLIAGATGSGKSVCINSILISLLYKADPNELKLLLIDPKMVELAPFNHIPHLVSPVITDVKAATAALKWAVEEMERRYQLFAHAGVRDLPRFNKLAESKGEYGHKLPYILIVIDELADLMMMSPADVEEAICRIAQKARACGIHLIVATQRPSVDVITGLIKSNIPTRIAFAVSSQIDSRTILDSQGAERLLGRGDMLYLGNGMSAPIRLQGTFVTDDEIEEIIEHVRGQGEPDYFFQQDELLKKTEMVEEQDELFEEVCRFVYEQGTASTSSIQRKYHIGYNRAARLIDMLESQGFVSEPRGSKPREVFITDSDLTSMFE